VPELPEVESARAAIERAALDRPIVDVDDTDTYVCRPHAPGEIRAALAGRTLTAANRQGKSIWCDTSGLNGAPTDGPELAMHLGMSGHIVVTDTDGEITEGGDWLASASRRAAARNPKNPAWNRFTISFADGG
jgi:formamidopyrimidine-DNA glycosylase